MLEVSSLTKQFGGLMALSDLDLKLEQGEILGIIGPNGAGKSTLFNTITGYHRPTRGKVFFEGKEITGLKPNRIASLGLIRTWQLVNLIGSRTAFENVRLAFHLRYKVGILRSVFNTTSARREREMVEAQTVELMDLLGLGPVKDEVASSLPHGQQRLLGICIALAARPKMLLLDEPTAGMSRAETTAMTEQIQRIRGEGVTVMLVEHDMKVIMNICDRILVLNFGRKLAEGTPREVASNEEVISAYLGYEQESPQDAA